MYSVLFDSRDFDGTCSYIDEDVSCSSWEAGSWYLLDIMPVAIQLPNRITPPIIQPRNFELQKKAKNIEYILFRLNDQG